MNKFTKILSIALSFITLAYLPNAAAASDCVSIDNPDSIKSILVTQETTLQSWPTNGGVRF